MDLTGACIGLAIFAPLMAVCAAVIRLTTAESAIFRQSRVGLRERIFPLYKFRTMSSDTDEKGKLLPDDLRTTRFGKFLRQSSIDELPQLWNVLRGDMSLVGPRPLLPQYLPRYTAFQRRRHEVTPGITGWAQVKGRNALNWPQKFELDVWYVDHQDLRLDVKIILMTLMHVVRRSDINHKGHAMPEFLGE